MIHTHVKINTLSIANESKKIKKEIRKYLETNKNKNTKYQNLKNAAKAE